jgi:hypothetical protein
MADLSTVYTLVGPDGTRIVFGNPDDPDFIGYVSEVGGLDGPETRESAELRADGDGGVHGDFFHGRRPVTLEGIIWPDPFDTRQEREERIARATNAMRADALLTWTPAGKSQREISLRRAQPPRIAGRRPKSFLIAMVSASAYMSSSAPQQIEIATGGTVTTNLAFPWVFPLDFVPGGGGSGGGSTFITNGGNAPASPTFRVNGPITNPVIRNETTGQEIRLIYDIASGDYIDIDVIERTIVFNSNTNRYSALDFANSEWWELVPGSNDVRITGSAFGSPASLVVNWRDAWI